MPRSLLACALLAGSLTAAFFAARSPLPVFAGQQTAPPPSHLPPTAENPLIAYKPHDSVAFHTSDRCVACHNGMKTAAGEEYSIGLDWEASIMGNSSRDPYWQGSIRRETLDHPESSQFIQNDCSFCHMATVRLADYAAHRDTKVFERFPFQQLSGKTAQLQRDAQDGVTCSVCHQIDNSQLGQPSTYNGHVIISRDVQYDRRPEWGPFDPDHGHQTIMHSSTAGFIPEQGMHIRDAALCAGCHTLITDALGPGGKVIAHFPEQVPYQEWEHSAYHGRKTCQECHMPAVKGPTPVTALYGPMRDGARHHYFVGANFFIQHLLNQHRDDLKTVAPVDDLTAASIRTRAFLAEKAARVSIRSTTLSGGHLTVAVLAQDLTGHKMPTAFPSRRAWLHIVVTDSQGRTVFESGALRADGSIVGNVNDEDPTRYEPYFHEITRPDQVEIFEPILGDAQRHVTTGLLNAVYYLKDSRLLPEGFDKSTADAQIAVHGNAATDPDFTDRGALVRYVVPTGGFSGPFHIKAELWYQPIGFRWAHNFAPYQAPEPQRMLRYYEADSALTANLLSSAEASR